MMYAGVLAQSAAAGGDDLAARGSLRRALLAQISLEKRRVVAIGDEANLLAIHLIGDWQSQAAGDLAHFGLIQLADRKQRAGQLRLRQAEEEVGLILACVHAFAQLIASGGVARNAGVVSGRNLRGANRIGHLQKLIELDEVVAKRAGDGRAPGQILADEGSDHLLLEALLEIHHVVGNAQALGYVAGVVDIIDGAATAAAALGGNLGKAPLVPELHGESDDVVALAREQAGNGGAVDTAAHGYRYCVLRHGRASGAKFF